MTNETFILTRLEDLLSALDARANVNIFVKIKDGQELLGSNKLYYLLADFEFIAKYSAYKVIGLTVSLGSTSILIEEA